MDQSGGAPKDAPRFHFIGIGGAGMSVVAELLADRGLRVGGSDRADTPALEHLRALGMDVHVGHDAAQVPPDAVVVVSSAVRGTNPELAAARSRGQRVIHRSQALALAGSGMRFVAVAGAHGKTTSSGMLTVALRGAGLDPSAAIGGVVPQLGGGAVLGRGDVLVAEADESDGSFLNYSPAVELVTNVEPDHLDHYGTREAFEQAFVDFADRLVEGGLLVCCVEDEGAARLAAAVGARHRVLTYGRPDHSHTAPDVAVVDVVAHPGSSSATFVAAAGRVPVEVSIPGVHNVLNAAGVWTVGVDLGVGPEVMAHHLRDFHGTSRRFEFRGQVGTRRLFDDYAHHPTEVAAALAEARTVEPDGPVTVVFQPHLYSRTRAFAARFAEALAHADVVVVTDVYGSREDPIPGVDSSLVTDRLPGSHLVHDMHEAARLGAELTGEGGILVTMGAGDITTTGADVLAQWRSEAGE